MPVPRMMGKVNKRVFNPREIRSGERPVLTHVGRSSGATYQTPLDAHEVDGGYIFILMYGSGCDWAQNILAAGEATLNVDGQQIELTSPTLMSRDEAWEQLESTDAKEPPAFLKVSEYMRMDTA
jgi:deazaflavin-dependent oxidoreductase (nitroreductase family)